MHVGGILIFEGPPPSYEDLLEHVRSRLHLVPRFRQKLAYPPVQTGRPFWIDDPSFNLEYHVRHSALPAPGSEEQLRRMAGRVFSQQLDRTKPLWELWLVQGLTRKRFALITKTHHALVDGVSGVDIATVLFDVKPVPEPAEPADHWMPSPEPSGATLVAKGVEDLLAAPVRAAQRLEHAVEHPDQALRRLSAAVEGVGEIGNRLAVMRAPIPVYISDPVRRLHTVSRAMQGLKQSKQALGAEVISRFNDFSPPTLLAQAARINFSTRLFNLVVTNVPGPQMPLYVLGRELQDIFPVGFLPPNQALFVAIMSYNGGVNFGLLADYDSMDDVQVVADGIGRGSAELVGSAEREAAPTAA